MKEVLTGWGKEEGGKRRMVGCCFWGLLTQRRIIRMLFLLKWGVEGGVCQQVLQLEDSCTLFRTILGSLGTDLGSVEDANVWINWLQ